MRYIKLGHGGEWEKACIEDNHNLRIGFRDTNHAQCLANKWKAVRNKFLQWNHNSATSTHFTNELKAFYTAPENVLWITFYNNLLWWCFSKPVITRLPDKTKIRPAIGGWKCESIDGKRLAFDHLSEKLLRLRMFNGTICTVPESEYVLNKINGSDDILKVGADKSVAEAEKSYAKSQGFQLDSKLRNALEEYAMDAAQQYFVSEGYDVKVDTRNHPYDLLCTRKKELLYVEVKGTQTKGKGIFLTFGEVEFNQQHKEQMALFLLHSIQVSKNKKRLSHGERHLVEPWDVDESCLKPVSYQYEIPSRK
jgi:hypothetical protein